MSDIQSKILSLVAARYENNNILISESGEVQANELANFYDRSLQNAFGRTGLALDTIDYELQRRRAGAAGVADKDIIKLSLVSSCLRVGSSDEYELAPRQFEDARYILLPTPKYDREKWIDQRLEELSTALETYPDIVCFPEFSYPPPAEKRTYRGSLHATPISRDQRVSNDYIDRSAYGRNRFQYEDRVRNKLKHKGEPFVFLGSYHCAFDFYNIGVIFPLGAEENSFQANLVSRQMDDPSTPLQKPFDIAPPVLYRKKFPARRMLEYARVPSNFEFHTFDIDGVNIATMICSDALDLNQFFNFARINTGAAGRKKIDIILVPAFNSSDKLLSMCRELSFFTGAFVVYVNANDSLFNSVATSDHSPASAKIADARTEIFVCGFSSKQLNELKGIANDIVFLDGQKDLPSGSVVYNFRIDLKKRKFLFDRLMKLRDDELTRGSSRTSELY